MIEKSDFRHLPFVNNIFYSYTLVLYKQMWNDILDLPDK